MQNPMQKVKRTRPSPFPIVVKCVVENLADYSNKETHSIRDFAISENVLFETRVYNSYRYSEDRYEIRQLPAFHVYTNGAYRRTFYPNTRPLQHIQECIADYRAAVEKKRQRRDYWRNFIPRTVDSLVKAVRKAFHRKTRMELAQEEREFQRRMEWS